MTKKRVYPIAAFILVFLSHALYFAWKTSHSADQCEQAADAALTALYFVRQEYFLGFSYALAAAFTVYALFKFAADRRRAAAGVIGGLTLTGGLYAAGCFLLGCCGSPLLAVYLGFLGASFLSFAKPLIAAITLLSVIGGYLWLEKKGGKCCGPAAACSETRAARRHGLSDLGFFGGRHRPRHPAPAPRRRISGRIPLKDNYSGSSENAPLPSLPLEGGGKGGGEQLR